MLPLAHYQQAILTLKQHLGTKDTGLVTRFAPSPTGYLHLGHIASALAVWGVARSVGGKVLLRIEDHDKGRYRPEYEQAILEDLHFFGFTADNLVSKDQLQPEFIQRHRIQHYEKLADQMLEKRLAYFCNCSRKAIQERTAGTDTGELYYDGFCRGNYGRSPSSGIRWLTPPTAVQFEDLLLGPCQQIPAEQCGDIPLLDRNGNWTYQFAVCIDDHDQGVNCIIRGQDLHSSTGRQILLKNQLFGHEPEPVFYLHHGLAMDKDGFKLSKQFLSDRASRMALSKEMLLAEAARALGIDPGPTLNFDQWLELLRSNDRG